MRISTHPIAILSFSLTLLCLPATLSAQDKKPAAKQSHIDPYTRGSSDENELVGKVRHSLLMLPYYGVFDDLGFRVNGATVTLMGEVTRPVLKEDAGNAVKRIAGVTNVVNNIEVLPLSPNDDNIRRAMYRAIYGDPSLSIQYGYSAVASIHIIVKNGNARLEGVVANEGDKNLAGIRAKGVNGVFDVQNDLQVEGK
jgi:hyperosmotically inducible protein